MKFSKRRTSCLSLLFPFNVKIRRTDATTTTQIIRAPELKPTVSATFQSVVNNDFLVEDNIDCISAYFISFPLFTLLQSANLFGAHFLLNLLSWNLK